ncbi:MAG: hypothetical protein ACRCZI_01635, partial [Cetobacterium sp.]
MVDRELILRYFAFKLKSYEEFYEVKITLSTFLDTLIYLTKLFHKNSLFNKTIIDKNKTATLNRSLFEIWTVLISGLSIEERKELLTKKLLLQEKYKS